MNRPNKPFHERCYERMETYSTTSECDQRTTAVTVASLIADSQVTVSDSEAAAPASQLKLDF